MLFPCQFPMFFEGKREVIKCAICIKVIESNQTVIPYYFKKSDWKKVLYRHTQEDCELLPKE